MAYPARALCPCTPPVRHWKAGKARLLSACKSVYRVIVSSPNSSLSSLRSGTAVQT
ncbi:hypothetical protein EUBHAL_02548 [Anaerobutyricum hallii DSM 3353]|uniref:Uncharacterized protein n=1 Tax=Anaerobutyricum hallii DSM 3353 TaxID=411469 RepID=C0EYP4_9FIRM|nr:hypothetical protein EUBHAL_02548 [Anaerobutyricum hallii DSM 3353]